ncbi:hypothetical protein [Zavarzinia aquatilis]|uniref:Uncharacterized protein n=1 Tax=Zavarzinia aquatilis TaxID=2211142 RepID=A0A317E7Q4_9PROT|nr:hypothetical protein [Zavarzinia aquatilis]PWR22969.1 hypothetical protein DKG74_11210 [Zavarzinia aquatilis]
MAKLRFLLSSTALATGLAAALPAAAQDAYPVSADQFGYGRRAVAEANFQVGLFGGGDSNGGTYGGAPSFTMPLGNKLGLQVDGIAGVTADEFGFAGGAVQLFYRDPERMALGVAGGGYFLEGDAQFAVAGIAEYYIDNVTLEGLIGFQDGDILESTVYGRVGASLYANPNVRIGAGLTYSDKVKLGGDLQVEALLPNSPGIALFATGTYDEDGAAGFGGIRFYFTRDISILSADRTKQAGGPTLIDIHRRLNRPNLFLADSTGFGLRQISRAAGAAAGGTPFGDVTPPAPTGCTVDLDPATPGCQSTAPDTGLVDVVDNVVNQIGDNTALQPITDLINALTDPNGGTLDAITGPLNQLTQIEGGPLGPLTELVQGLVGTNNSALTPLIDTLNGIIGGLAAGSNPTDIAGGLSSLPGADSLAGLLGGTLPGGTDTGLIDLVNNVLSDLGDNTAVQPLTDLLNALTNPTDGNLAPLTGALNELTAVDGGPLGPLTELVGALAGTDNAALNPLVQTLNGILGGFASGAGPTDIAGSLASLPGADQLAGLFGGIPLPGGSDTGLIDLVNTALADLGDNTVIQPLTDLLNALTNPTDGNLAPLTGALNDLTAVDGGPLGPLTQLVGTLAGTDNAALNPLVDTLNGILGGLAAGASPTDIATGLSSLPSTGALADLFGGTPLTGGIDTGLIDLVNNVLGDLGDNTAIQPLTDLLNALTNPVDGGLSPLTSALNELTALDGGPLAPLTELTGALAGTDTAALNPLVDTLNTILGGFAAGADPTDIASGLSSLPGLGQLADLLGGSLSGGSATAGLIDTVNGVLDSLGDTTAIQPLTDLLTTLTATDQGAALAGLTQPLNDLTALDGGALAPLTQLVDGLVGVDTGALTPLIDTLNTILGGLGGGQDLGTVADTVTTSPTTGLLAGLLGL